MEGSTQADPNEIGILPENYWVRAQFGATSRYVGILHERKPYWHTSPKFIQWSCIMHFTAMPYGRECPLCARNAGLEQVTIS